VSAPVAYVRVASISQLAAGSLLGVTGPDGERVCLVNYGGDIHAVGDECPHQGFPLSAGELLPDGEIECVWHGARFDCRSGVPTRGPADSPLERYDVRVVDGNVLLGPVLR
jgi:3-phenylpropionate/trans-cinnamate dioxygenase ferredoxin subunit